MALGTNLLREVLEAMITAPDPAHGRARAVGRLYRETGHVGRKARRFLRDDAARLRLDGMAAACGDPPAPEGNLPSVRTMAAVLSCLHGAGRGDLASRLVAQVGGPAVRAQRLAGAVRPPAASVR